MTTIAPAPTTAPPRANAWLVAGAVLGAVTVLMAAVWFAGLIAPQHQDTVDLRLPAAARLVVHIPSGDVTVTGADGDQIAGSVQRVWSLVEPELTTSRDGDTAELRIGTGLVSWGDSHTKVELSVPRGTQVELHGSSGDLSVSQLQADVTATTDSGWVTATGVAGRLTARTNSGDLVVAHHTGDLDLAVDSGKIEVTDSAAPHVTAADSSGDIHLDLADDPEQVTAHVLSGRIQVLLPDTPGEAYLLDLRSGSGHTSGDVRADPDSPRTITATANSGDVTVGYGR
jgi:hypothetical protein